MVEGGADCRGKGGWSLNRLTSNVSVFRGVRGKRLSARSHPFTRLRLIAPVIKDHGVDYERGKFQDKLKDGTLTLERTKV